MGISGRRVGVADVCAVGDTSTASGIWAAADVQADAWAWQINQQWPSPSVVEAVPTPLIAQC